MNINDTIKQHNYFNIISSRSNDFIHSTQQLSSTYNINIRLLWSLLVLSHIFESRNSCRKYYTIAYCSFFFVYFQNVSLNAVIFWIL